MAERKTNPFVRPFPCWKNHSAAPQTLDWRKNPSFVLVDCSAFGVPDQPASDLAEMWWKTKIPWDCCCLVVVEMMPTHPRTEVIHSAVVVAAVAAVAAETACWIAGVRLRNFLPMNHRKGELPHHPSWRVLHDLVATQPSQTVLPKPELPACS